MSLLGGDSLYATAQWAMAKLHSRQFRGPVNTLGTFCHIRFIFRADPRCRKLIAQTIASCSVLPVFLRPLLWAGRPALSRARAAGGGTAMASSESGSCSGPGLKRLRGLLSLGSLPEPLAGTWTSR